MSQYKYARKATIELDAEKLPVDALPLTADELVKQVSNVLNQNLETAKKVREKAKEKLDQLTDLGTNLRLVRSEE